MKGEQLIGVTAAELMELLGRDTTPNAEISEVVVAVLVTVNDESGEPDWGYTQWRFSTPIRHHQRGMLEVMLDAHRNAPAARIVEFPEEGEPDDRDDV